jgi:archaeal flagellin FlaB
MSNTKNKGMMGIGTLIIFIAVILVAAVAAAVLITTAGNLQQKALVTGGQAEQGVATGAEAISVMGTNGTDHNIEILEMLIRLQSGSESMKLNYTALVLDTADTSQNLEYSQSMSSTTAAYGVEYVKHGENFQDGYLSRGDVVKIYANLTSSIGENQKVRMRVIPRSGSPTIVEFTTPDVMTDQRVTLWP